MLTLNGIHEINKIKLETGVPINLKGKLVAKVKEKKISFLMDEEELRLLDKVVMLEPCLQDVVNSARRVKSQYRVRSSLEDLKEALGALSYAAGCMASYPENEKMYKLHEKIEALIILHQALKNS